jgi:ribosomal protein S18 acetylase RimI-like enzyme
MQQSFPPGIRAARPEDEAAWRRMWADFIKEGPEPCGEDAPASVWRGVHDESSPYALLLAVDEQDRPQGFLLSVTHPWSWSARPACYLLDLYVAPEARGQGKGRALMEALAAQGRREGWLKIYWMTQADNATAQRLYDKLATRSPLVRYDMLLNEH